MVNKTKPKVQGKGEVQKVSERTTKAQRSSPNSLRIGYEDSPPPSTLSWMFPKSSVIPQLNFFPAVGQGSSWAQDFGSSKAVELSKALDIFRAQLNCSQNWPLVFQKGKANEGPPKAVLGGSKHSQRDNRPAHWSSFLTERVLGLQSQHLPATEC